jgi:hypothetical protein
VLSGSRDISEVLGLDLGVRVPSPDVLPTVFFAAMAGRTASFDEGSFERWQHQMEQGDPRVEFARQLVFDDLLPVEFSRLEKVSLGSLAARGPAWVVAGSELWADRPVVALGIVVAGEFGASLSVLFTASAHRPPRPRSTTQDAYSKCHPTGSRPRIDAKPMSPVWRVQGALGAVEHLRRTLALSTRRNRRSGVPLCARVDRGCSQPAGAYYCC